MTHRPHQAHRILCKARPALFILIALLLAPAMPLIMLDNQAYAAEPRRVLRENPFQRSITKHLQCLQGVKRDTCPKAPSKALRHETCRQWRSTRYKKTCLPWLVRAARRIKRPSSPSQKRPQHLEKVINRRIRLAQSWFQYHKLQFGPPLPPPLKDLTIHNQAAKEKVQLYIKNYQRHRTHLSQAIHHLRRLYNLESSVGGLTETGVSQNLGESEKKTKQEFRVLKLWMRLQLLKTHDIQSQYNVAMLRYSLNTHQQRQQDQGQFQKLQQSVKRMQRDLRTLRKRVRQKTKKRSDATRTTKRTKLAQQRQQLKSTMNQLNLTLRRGQQNWRGISLQLYLHRGLDQESRFFRQLNQESASPAIWLAQWDRSRRCENDVESQYKRRQKTSSALFWSGMAVSTLGLGVAGGGIGAYYTSLSEDLRPFEAEQRQGLGLGLMIGGGVATLIGVGLWISSAVVSPSDSDLTLALRRCRITKTGKGLLSSTPHSALHLTVLRQQFRTKTQPLSSLMIKEF